MRTIVLMMLIGLALATTAPARQAPAGGTPTQRLVDHVADADRVVRGTVTSLESRMASNEFGDQLIVTQVQLNVLETLKGQARPTASAEVVGGTVGSLSLISSAYPAPLTVGDRAIAIMARGRVLPYGWIKLDSSDVTVGPGPTLAEVRRAVRGLF